MSGSNSELQWHPVTHSTGEASPRLIFRLARYPLPRPGISARRTASVASFALSSQNLMVKEEKPSGSWLTRNHVPDTTSRGITGSHKSAVQEQSTEFRCEKPPMDLLAELALVGCQHGSPASYFFNFSLTLNSIYLTVKTPSTGSKRITWYLQYLP